MNTALIASSWQALAPRHDELVYTMYRRLFARHPEYRRLFPDNMDAQMRRMVDALAFMAEYADQRAALRPHALKLGRAHRSVGVTRTDLANVIDVLLEVMAEFGAERWSEACTQAWRDAFAQVLVPHMLEGLAEPQPA